MESELEPIRAELEIAVRDVAPDVTQRAQELVTAIVDAMVTDPHPAWSSEDRRKVTALQFGLRNDLPRVLRDIALKENVRGTITTFDVLHWLAANLDSICPVKK